MYERGWGPQVEKPTAHIILGNRLLFLPVSPLVGDCSKAIRKNKSVKGLKRTSSHVKEVGKTSE